MQEAPWSLWNQSPCCTDPSNSYNSSFFSSYIFSPFKKQQQSSHSLYFCIFSPTQVTHLAQPVCQFNMFSKMLSSAAALMTLVSIATSAAIPDVTMDERFIAKRALTGQATFYGGNTQGGACSFSTYTLPAGLFGTALSSSDWDTSAMCGGCVKVKYGGKSITAMVSCVCFV